MCVGVLLSGPLLPGEAGETGRVAEKEDRDCGCSDIEYSPVIWSQNV